MSMKPRPVAFALPLVLALAATSAVAGAWPTKAQVLAPKTTKPRALVAAKSNDAVPTSAQRAAGKGGPTASPPIGDDPPLDAPVISDLSGNYSVAGKGDDGKSYAGTATISKIGGDLYRAKTTIGDNSFLSVCIYDAPRFGCAWSLKAKDANIIQYVGRENGLDGAWFEEGDTSLGKEYAHAPPTGTPKSLAGTYTVGAKDGVTPNGRTYGATLTVTPDAIAGVFHLHWVFSDGGKEDGLALRSSRKPELLTGAFADGTADEYGTLVYEVHGISAAKLSFAGEWAQSIKGQTSHGKEALTKL